MSETTSTPEPATAPVATATPSEPAYVERAPRRSRLNTVAAWVGIVAGTVFVVAVIFFSGFILGAHAGGHHGGHHRGGGDGQGQMWHHRGPQGPGGGQFGPGGPQGGFDRQGPGGQGGPGAGPGGGPGGQQSPTTSPSRPS